MFDFALGLQRFIIFSSLFGVFIFGAVIISNTIDEEWKLSKLPIIFYFLGSLFILCSTF